MFWRWTALVGFMAVSTPMMLVADDEQVSALSASSFQNWTGVVTRTTLKDHSILSEYVSYTRAINDKDAILQVAFSPRFGCTPMIRLSVPTNSAALSVADTQLQFRIDGDLFDFPALLDNHASSREYSYSANASRQQGLRLVLDTASRLQVLSARSDVTSALTDESDSPDLPRFSLLGSRLSVEAVEFHCRNHVPLEFELQGSN